MFTTSVSNNNSFSRTFQLIEFLSCFSTIMSTLHDGSLVRQKWKRIGQFKGGNSVVPIYLVTYLGRDIMPLIIVTKFQKDLTKAVNQKRTSNGYLAIRWLYWKSLFFKSIQYNSFRYLPRNNVWKNPASLWNLTILGHWKWPKQTSKL